jgi:uncharacterized membrane protein
MKPISRLQAYKSQFKRFSMILACALIVSAATYIFDPESFVFFGVLHLVSVASLFFIVVGRNIYLIYSFLFLLILLGSMTFASDNIIMQILGLSELQKNSVDFFPVVPWFVVILLGYLSSKYLLGFYKKLSLNVKNTCTAKVGRKSLLIYMVHQPILIAILLLLKHGVLSK